MWFMNFFWPISKDNAGLLPSKPGKGPVLRTVCLEPGGTAAGQEVRPCLSFCCASV